MNRSFHHQNRIAACVFMLGCSSNNAPAFNTRDGQANGASEPSLQQRSPRNTPMG